MTEIRRRRRRFDASLHFSLFSVSLPFFSFPFHLLQKKEERMKKRLAGNIECGYIKDSEML